MPIQQTLHESRVPVHIWTDDVDAASKRPLTHIAKPHCVFEHVAAMPDVPLGLGGTIGSVIATQNAILPAAVGVDLVCGNHFIEACLDAGEPPLHVGASHCRLAPAFARV